MRRLENDMTSALLTAEMCARAWDILLPAIARAAETGVINKFDSTILVLDPTVQYREGGLISDALLFANRVMVYEDADHDRSPTIYDTVATEKAMLSWRTGLSSREVQQSAPHLYQRADVKWAGSVVRNGLVVSFSGVQAEFDEWISGMMADLLDAMCRYAMNHKDGIMSDGHDAHVM